LARGVAAGARAAATAAIADTSNGAKVTGSALTLFLFRLPLLPLLLLLLLLLLGLL
jgi:hypothetical protein